MNYSKLYGAVIANAKSEVRTKGQGIYFEKHHIIPRCLGGSNTRDNLVLLTAKEHFICHHLLTKMYPDETKLRTAFAIMCYKPANNGNREYRISSKVFANAKESHSKIMSDRNVTEETRKRMSESAKVKAFSDEHRKNISRGQIDRYSAPGFINTWEGKTHSDESKAKMSLKQSGENNGFFGKTHNEETRAKISSKNKGKLISEEFKINQSALMKRKKWFTNGVDCLRAEESPGPNWRPGRIIEHRTSKKEFDKETK